MYREIIYFCAELLNYWSMTFFGLKLFSKVYEFSGHKNKNVENVIYAVLCLPISIVGALHYYFLLYSIFITYMIIIYLYFCLKIVCKIKKCFSFISLYVFFIRLLDLWVVSVIAEVNFMSREANIDILNKGMERIGYIIILSFLYYFIYVIGHKSNFMNYLKESRIYCRVIVIYAFLGNSCFNRVYWFERNEKLIGYWIFYLICAFILIGGCWLYFIEIKIKEKQRLLNMRNDMLESNYHGLKIAYDENKTLQHDYNNHILTVREYIIENKLDEALQYICTYLNYARNIKNDVKTGNDVIDIIVNSKINEAREKNVNFVYELDDLHCIPIADIDMCALLANLLDNAIEACENIEDYIPTMQLKILIKNEMLIIYLKNNVHSRVLMKENLFKSEKANPQLHGWGMRSIEQVVKKYVGTKEYYLDKNWLEIVITIPF